MYLSVKTKHAQRNGKSIRTTNPKLRVSAFASRGRAEAKRRRKPRRKEEGLEMLLPTNVSISGYFGMANVV